MRHAGQQTLYEQLEALPEGLTGEILNGQLHTQPRPTGPHALTESNLQIEIGGAFGKGPGGPGGWWIPVEPEIHFVTDREVLVPDLAGWRKNQLNRGRGALLAALSDPRYCMIPTLRDGRGLRLGRPESPPPDGPHAALARSAGTGGCA